MSKKIPCMVYSRVCGFYRPVCGWNKGKTEEFKERKTYKIPKGLNNNERESLQKDTLKGTSPI